MKRFSHALMMLTLLAGAALSCGQPADADLGALGLGFAAQAIGGPCPETPTPNAEPPALDRLELFLSRRGKQIAHHVLTVKAGAAPRVSGLPAGEGLALQLFGYQGEDAVWSGAATGVSVKDGKTSAVDVFLSPVGDTGCTPWPLGRPRAFLAAAALPNGQVVLAGGLDASSSATAAVDLFDPGTGTVFPIAPLNSPRAFATATLLANGRLLVAGGARRAVLGGDKLPATIAEGDLVQTFEVYLPDQNRWIEKPLPQGLIFHTATLLTDGRVLLAGGGTGFLTASKRAFLYLPTGESVGAVAPVEFPMNAARIGHAAVFTPYGRVLLLGGAFPSSAAVAEEFVPETEGGSFNSCGFSGSASNLFFGSASIVPLFPDVVMLAGGSFFNGTDGLNPPLSSNVRMITGVSGNPDQPLSLSSIEGPVMRGPRLLSQIVWLDTNRLLLTGGFSALDLTPSVWIDEYLPEPNTFSPTPLAPLSTPRGGHAAVGLAGGRVLVAGGLGMAGPLGSAEVFTPPDVLPEGGQP